MKMRELETRTGVHRETIRVYLRHGLLPEPERPRRNVADYGEQHVEAISAIQRLQRENRLTLAEIVSVLGGDPLERRLEANAFTDLEQLVAARVQYDRRLVTIQSLVQQSARALEDARAMEQLGIISILGGGPEGDALSLPDAQLVLIWGDMRAAGFVEALDFVPEMLGFYVQAAEFVAGSEARTFMERTEGKIDVEAAAAMLQAALPLMLNFFGILRMRAFMRNINATDGKQNLAP